MPPELSVADKAYAAGAAAMAEGNHERALEAFSTAWKERPGHPGVSKDFPEALTRLKNSGDEAFRQGRAEEAGRRWSSALRHLSHPAEKGKILPFGKADLRSSIDHLSASLMEKGLVEYRKGNLEAAIASWRAILSYDPSHEEAARSLQTATTQLENLKKISPPK
jgi:tetratricopeptide (TPR) repeat protein